MTIGGEQLLAKYGNALSIGEAFLEGKLSNFEMKYVEEVVSRYMLDAAKMRIELREKSKKE